MKTSQKDGKESSCTEEKDQKDLDTPTIAELYFKQGLYEKAAEIYSRLEKRSPEVDDYARRRRTIEGMVKTPMIGKANLERDIMKLQKILDAAVKIKRLGRD